MRSAKFDKRLLLIIPLAFGLLGAYVGAWLSLADPDAVTQNSISGALVGLIVGGFLALMAKGASPTTETDQVEEGEAARRQEEFDRKRALRYQKYDFASSCLQTAFAILLVAIAYSVVRSSQYRSLLFFFLVVYPAIAIASRLVFRSWGWVGKVVVLAGWPVLYVGAGVWLMAMGQGEDVGWGAVIIALGLHVGYQSLQKYRKVKSLIAKYPADANRDPEGDWPA